MPRISSGVQIRNGMIFINKMLNGKYHRFSTGLESNKNNLRYVRKNIMQIIADKERQDNVSGANFREKMRTQKNVKKIDFSIHQPANDSVDKCDFTLKAAIALLAKEWMGLKPTSKAIYESISKQLLLYFGEDCLVSDINRAKIADFFNYCLEKKYKKSFINLKFGILKRVLVLAEEYGVIDKVPNLRFKMPMETEMTQKVKAFSENEVRLLLNSCKNQVLRNYLQIAFFTGCRTGEILALKWSDIDFKAGKISINKTINYYDITLPKTRSSIRDIDILPLVKEALKRQKQLSGKNEYIFCSKDNYIRFHDKLQKEWKLLLQNVGLEYRTLYHTRHTFASIMLSHSENLLWVSKRMLGHTNANMTLKIYAHYVETQRQEHGIFLKDFLKTGA
ncbi:site-specific integrase [Helicobacter sp.]|uniref:tyrosine-type recombinase/integrase n=1 Tax=Helicobacter sp. TaxID=218 RepID=UPI0025C60D03|nr:site-specific integrase [Helicobacter sp.]MCI5632411.1 site-specific integrase [Helicobacter sp.]